LLKVALNIINLKPNERAISCLSVYIYHTKFFWALCCLFFDIRILITPLVSLCSSVYT
jgi:hypothetical protein